MIHVRFLVVICIVVLLTGVAPTPKKFAIDTRSSSGTWRWHNGKEQHSGMVFISSGELLRNKAGITGGTITVDMNSLSVNTVRDLRQNSLVTGWMKGPQFFNTYEHPVAVLKLTAVGRGPGNRYTLNGTLTVKDKAIPVRIPADIRFEKRRIEVTALLTVYQQQLDKGDSTNHAFKLNLHIIGRR